MPCSSHCGVEMLQASAQLLPVLNTWWYAPGSVRMNSFGFWYVWEERIEKRAIEGANELWKNNGNVIT